MSASLDPLFRPRAVAVIGASRDPRSIGGSILRNLLRFGFNGLVFPVNPAAAVVQSLKSYPTVEAIPDPVDLAIIAVPRPLVLEAIEACGRKGVRAAVVITAGFKEVGATGAALERQVVDRARAHGMRLVGPNCMGIMNLDPGVRLQASFSATEPSAGNVAFSSQSGALGEAILSLLVERGLGLSMFASLGNKADISGNDLLEYWEHDPRTDVVLMYLESFGNPQKFVQICRRVARRKPILAVKSGRTEAGARAAASHTGSLAGAEHAVSALLAQAGVVRAGSVEQLFVYATAFASQPVPRGRRVAIVTNSGGPGILAADACSQLGLAIPPLAEATQARMRAVVAPEASVVNPVDMIATATGPQYEACVRAALEDPQIDAVIAIFTSLEMIDGPGVAEGIVRGAGGSDKPVLVCFMGSVRSREAIDVMRRARLPVYTFPEDAAAALGAMVQYRRWLDRPAGRIVRFDDMRRDALRHVLGRAAAERRQHLALAEALRLVEAARVPVLPWQEAATPDAAAEAAGALEGAVALKVSSARLVHKSEVGGVRLALADAAVVRAAAAEMLARAQAIDPDATLVVQRMAAGGTEVIAGASRDPKFGPLLMFGLGGIYVEVLKDVAFRVHPLTDADAHDMLREIKGFPILAGARGAPAADLDALAATLLRLDQLAGEFPDIAEIEINPLFAAPAGVPSAAADARVALRQATP